MGSVERPGAVEIHWDSEGSGPAVVIAHQLLWSYPQIYEELIRDLAGDHRVVTYDPRGCGRSSEQGPYDAETDASDLLAVLEDAGGPAVALAVGYGYNLAVRVAARRPDLITAVVTVQPAAAALLPRSELRESGVLAASESVIEMLMQMMDTDPRTALRTVIAATNPQVDEEGLRERLDRVADYLSYDAARERAAAWLADDPSDYARAVGDRPVITQGEDAEPLFEGMLTARVEELYPDARVEQLGGGPISRPDLIAARIRRLTAGADQ
jgi:pimeloyl-ACP methyl ester carboxylesterase